MADAKDLKSFGGNPVRVRVPPRALQTLTSFPVRPAVCDAQAIP